MFRLGPVFGTQMQNIVRGKSVRGVTDFMPPAQLD